MSVKVRVSATEKQELNEILAGLRPVVSKRRYKVKVKVKPPDAEKGKYVAYIYTQKVS